MEYLGDDPRFRLGTKNFFAARHSLTGFLVHAGHRVLADGVVQQELNLVHHCHRDSVWFCWCAYGVWVISKRAASERTPMIPRRVCRIHKTDDNTCRRRTNMCHTAVDDACPSSRPPFLQVRSNAWPSNRRRYLS